MNICRQSCFPFNLDFMAHPQVKRKSINFMLIKLLMKITSSDHFMMIILPTESSICDQLQFNGLFRYAEGKTSLHLNWELEALETWYKFLSFRSAADAAKRPIHIPITIIISFHNSQKVELDTRNKHLRLFDNFERKLNVSADWKKRKGEKPINIKMMTTIEVKWNTLSYFSSSRIVRFSPPLTKKEEIGSSSLSSSLEGIKSRFNFKSFVKDMKIIRVSLICT